MALIPAQIRCDACERPIDDGKRSKMARIILDIQTADPLTPIDAAAKELKLPDWVYPKHFCGPACLKQWANQLG